eukprot:1282839-Pleurochrysis_carterae.AAC.1
MTDARLPDATFSTTEYCQTSLSGVLRLWGTSAPLVNSAYDAHNKRSGIKFTRHNHLHREAQLARLLPDKFPFPDRVPDSHAPTTGAAGAASARSANAGSSGGGRGAA